METIFIFGASSAGEKVYNKLNKRKVKILGFIDNDSKKWGQVKKDIPIYGPQFIVENKFDFIVIGSQYFLEIRKQLLNLGIPENKIILLKNDFGLEHEKQLIDNNRINRMSRMFYGQKKLKIAIQNFNNSKYQGKIMYEKMPKVIKENFSVDLIKDRNTDMLEYDIIISSTLDGVYTPGYINYELWHGFPIKQIGIMDDKVNIDKGLILQISSYIDKVFSYSKIFNIVFNAANLASHQQYEVTGNPRNDYLFKKNKTLKHKITNGHNYNHIIIYLPTWRSSFIQNINTSKNTDVIFGYENENLNDLNKFLEKNNILLIYKNHDIEESKVEKNSKNIFSLNEGCLLEWNVHLYEIFSFVDLLITDYSSVYFDTLLIDLPIIFAHSDLEEFKSNKGFWIDNYETLMPGPSCTNYNTLLMSISKFLNGQDDYKKERKFVKNLIHYYQDQYSTDRVWNMIIKDLKSKALL